MSDESPEPSPWNIECVPTEVLVHEVAKRHNGMVLSLMPKISRVGQTIVPQVFFSGGYLVALAMSLKLFQYMDNILPCGPQSPTAKELP